MEDDECWETYPQHHKWFNKLYLAERMGYDCGPGGVVPKKTNFYIVRPIYNLSGLGIGAEIKHIKADDATKVPPGYFWCEYFTGFHYSATYEFVHATKPYWKMLSCWKAEQQPNNLTKFTKWTRNDWAPDVPKIFNELSDVKIINIEFKGDNPIEVHLRDSPDPDYDELIPVWTSDLGNKKEYIEKHGYEFIESYDDADGFLDDPRVGFLVRYTK